MRDTHTNCVQHSSLRHVCDLDEVPEKSVCQAGVDQLQSTTGCLHRGCRPPPAEKGACEFQCCSWDWRLNFQIVLEFTGLVKEMHFGQVHVVQDVVAVRPHQVLVVVNLLFSTEGLDELCAAHFIHPSAQRDGPYSDPVGKISALRDARQTTSPVASTGCFRLS